MTINELLGGCQLLGADPNKCFSAEHDQIWIDAPDEQSEETVKKAKELGWFYDNGVGAWSHYV